METVKNIVREGTRARPGKNDAREKRAQSMVRIGRKTGLDGWAETQERKKEKRGKKKREGERKVRTERNREQKKL